MLVTAFSSFSHSIWCYDEVSIFDMNNSPEVKKAPYEEALHFISFCNSLSEGSSEGRIADTVLKHTDHISALTVEQLADEAAVSLSSVSRFFSKAGFESFSSFKNIFSEYLNDISRIRMRSIYPQPKLN